MSSTAEGLEHRIRPKPPLKWAGGKRWLVPRLKALFEPYRQYRLVEPFCGGLAVAFGLLPRFALLNDVNPHAVNFYQHLSKGLRIRLKMQNDGSLYYAHRDEFNRLIQSARGRSSRKAAELFYFLNRTGYNGLCRFNSKGGFNVPFGKHARINYRVDFSEYTAYLSRWAFSDRDFAELGTETHDFVYADPPYDVEFRSYAEGGFDWSDQERLVHWLCERPGPVVASNQATPRIKQLYLDHGFQIDCLPAPRYISCNGDRRHALEILATRNLD